MKIEYSEGMDQLTEEAIKYLRSHGRASFSEIASSLGASRANVSHRLTPLFENGSLRVIAAIHPRLLGKSVLAHVRLATQGQTGPIIERLKQHEDVVFLSETVGEYQVAVEFHTQSVQTLHRILWELQGCEQIRETHLHQYVDVHSSTFIGEEPRRIQVRLDESDFIIAQQLRVDGRKSYTELAKATGLSVSATRDHVEKLISSGVLQIGVVRGRNSSDSELVFGFGITTLFQAEAVIDLLRETPGLEVLTSAVGSFNLLATISFQSLVTFNEFLEQLRTLPQVLLAETWLHSKIHLENYVHMK